MAPLIEQNIFSMDLSILLNVLLVMLCYIFIRLTDGLPMFCALIDNVTVNSTIRKSRLQPPLHAHEYITKTCKYRLPVFLNSINNNSENSDILRNIIDEINNITLVKFKSVTKRYMINKYSYP